MSIINTIIKGAGGGGGAAVTKKFKDNGTFLSVRLDSFTVPTTDNEGDPCPTTMTWDDYDGQYVMSFVTKKLIVPAYYTTWNAALWSRDRRGGDECLETIRYEGTTLSRAGGMARSVHNWELPNCTSLNMGNDNGWFILEPNRYTTATFKAPLLTNIRSGVMGWKPASGSECYDITGSDISSATTFWTEGGIGNCKGTYLNGTLEAPSVVTFGDINLPVSGTAHYKFPVATTNTDAFMYETPTAEDMALRGTMHLYLGANFTGFVSDYAARVGIGSQANKIIIHIPAGDSTTKTYLDSINATYTQDYTP